MGERRITDLAKKFLQVKDWREFQHYHDRNPSWIKLHKKILDNADFQRLPIASKALAPMLWLLASESEQGLITWEPDNIAWRLRMTVKEFHDALNPLITKGFFVVIGDTEQDASDTLALMEHPASLEKETYTQEKEKDLVASATRRKQLPDDFRPKDHHKNLAERLSVCLEDEFEKFRDFHRAKGNVMKDWDLAFNTWLRNTRQYGGRNGKRESAFERVANEPGQAN